LRKQQYLISNNPFKNIPVTTGIVAITTAVETEPAITEHRITEHTKTVTTVQLQLIWPTYQS